MSMVNRVGQIESAQPNRKLKERRGKHGPTQAQQVPDREGDLQLVFHAVYIHAGHR
jgi:hypothetical protein